MIYSWKIAELALNNNTSAGGILVPEGIIRKVVNSSALTYLLDILFF